MPQVVLVENNVHYAAAFSLFKEYAEWLNIDLGFQNFARELETLEDVYGPPKGAIFLLQSDNIFVGSIAFRALNEHTAELKRMYVQPAYRGKGFATLLLTKAEEKASLAGYRSVKLDTLASMLPAMNFYKNNGYSETEPYYYNPNSNTVYFEKALT